MTTRQEFTQILFDDLGDGIARITLNRPDRMNAYTPTMCRELVACLEHYRAEDALRVLIITGSGRAFCAGGDIGQDNGFESYRDKQFGSARALRETMHAVNLTLHRIDKPVIAMINGAAIAGGLMLAQMCDYRFASESARLGDTSGAAGLLVDEGGAWIFPRVLRMDQALRMVWLSEIYSAPKALELGLVSEVVPDESLEGTVLEFAGRIARSAPLAVRANKWMMRRGLESSFEHSLEDAAMAVNHVNRSDDAREGMQAFRGKRPPRFQGS